jgi:hypothetical protein
MKVVVVSNGHGEDCIATNIVSALLEIDPNSHIEAYPLVGNGHPFSKLNIPIKLDNPIFPSGGFIRSLSDAYTDISHGLLQHLSSQRRTIKKGIKDADLIIAVGDIFCLWQSRGESTKTIFLPTAKSDTFMPHSKLEKWLIKRYSTLCLPRDELTTTALKNDGINAHYFGNPMMDNLLDQSSLEVSIKPNSTLVGILPGSREEAYDNLLFIDTIIEQLSDTITAVAALSPSIDKTRLTALKHCHLSHQFKPLITQCAAVIGLAGTANEQAAFLGKPVLCFPGFGPQSTAQRFEEQHKLMGDNIHFVNSQDPTLLAQELQVLLNTPQARLPNTNQHAAQDIAKKILSTISVAKG